MPVPRIRMNLAFSSIPADIQHQGVDGRESVATEDANSDELHEHRVEEVDRFVYGVGEI